MGPENPDTVGATRATTVRLDTSPAVDDTSGMRSLFVLALLACTARADCPRDPLYPAELPWIECPIRVAPSPCTRCGAHATILELDYTQPPAELRALVRRRFADAGWTLELSATTESGGVSDRMHLDRLRVALTTYAHDKGTRLYVHLERP
jgi:hypothetical protein